jgi:glutaredoxin
LNKTNSAIKVYSLPDCNKCDELKTWLNVNNIDFEAKWFDSEAQTEFVMRNMFGNPPILEVGDRFAGAEEMFRTGILNEGIVRDIIGIKEE